MRARARGRGVLRARQPRHELVAAALTAAGVARGPSLVTTYEITQGSPVDRFFIEATLASGYADVTSASWPSDADSCELGEVLYRQDSAVVSRLPGGLLAAASVGHGWLRVTVASPTREQASAAVASFRAAFPPLYRQEEDDGTVPITFWTYGRFGPESRLRKIEASPWAEIVRNYSAAVRDGLAGLMEGFEPGKDGQLILWQGEPGTGKTWALRALASEWSDWAEFHYITDPDAFFVDSPSYMIDVLLADSYEELLATPDGGYDIVTSNEQDGKWRVLVLEDTGELLAADAKEKSGQGLSRLLNVVDGMVGQGLRVLVVVTTNDELGDLHPAVSRPGRCAAALEFGPLSPEEATEWAGEPIDGPATLAELYARPSLTASASPAFAEPGTLDYADGSVASEHVYARATSDEEAAFRAVLALAGAPLPGEAADAPPEPSLAASVAESASERDVDSLTAAAFDALRDAHARTVSGIGELAAGRRSHDEGRALTAAALTAVEALGRAANRELPAPRVELTVNTPDVHVSSPDINVDVRTPDVSFSPHVEVHVPEQKAPVVNVDLELPATAVTVAAAAPQPAPQVTVNVPAQPTPDVHVNVEAAKPRAVRVEYDGEGNKIYVPEEVQ